MIMEEHLDDEDNKEQLYDLIHEIIENVLQRMDDAWSRDD